MRNEFIELVKKTIIFKYHLPRAEICKSNYTTSEQTDRCFECSDSEKLSEVIYNGIIEYAENEFDIDYNNIQKSFKKIVNSMGFRYFKGKENLTKNKKLGFFGEVLLDTTLRIYFDSKVIIAKGKFVDIKDKREATGYDCYHFVYNKSDGILELWFGEVKFYTKFDDALNSVFLTIQKDLSSEYFSEDIIRIIRRQKDSHIPPVLEQVISKWENNSDINIIELIKKHNIKLIYPIFIAYQPTMSLYDETILKKINSINSKSLKLDNHLNWSIYFILLPVNEVAKVKEKVIEWIEEMQPLI